MSRSYDSEPEGSDFPAYSSEDEDIHASVQAYFEQLPAQDREAWESLPEIAERAVAFKSAARALAVRLGYDCELVDEDEPLQLVEAEPSADGPRYTVVAHLSESEDLLFRGRVSGATAEAVVCEVSLDYDELGSVKIFLDSNGREPGFSELLLDGSHEPGTVALSSAYAQALETRGLSGSLVAVPPLSPLERPLSPDELVALPTVLDLEEWPVLDSADDDAPGRGSTHEL